MPRTMLTDEYLSTLSRLLLETGRIYNKQEHRMTLEGILYRMRVGCPWRNIPELLAIGIRFIAVLILVEKRCSSSTASLIKAIN